MEETTITLTLSKQQIWALARAISGEVTRIAIRGQYESAAYGDHMLQEILMTIVPLVNDVGNSFIKDLQGS